MQHSPTNDNNQRPAEFDANLVQLIPWLHKMARRMERNEQYREDIINDTIATALRRWASYRADGNFAGWLAFNMRDVCRTARKNRRSTSISTDAKRRHTAKDGSEYEDAYMDSASEPARQENIVELAQVVGAMRPREAAILLRRAEGETLEEVGNDMGITRERVRQLEVAARERLSKRLNTVRVGRAA